MTWFDPSGWSLFGPSSEWLWTMLGTIAVIVSLAIIYREVRLQSAVKEMQQVNELEAEWESERLARQRLRLYEGMRDGERIADINAAWRIAAYWDKVGSLTRAGHITLSMLVDTGGADAVLFWALLRDFIADVRQEKGIPTAFAHFEWLADRVRSSKHNFDYFERPVTPEQLTTAIEDEQTYIALEVALRTTPG